MAVCRTGFAVWLCREKKSLEEMSEFESKIKCAWALMNLTLNVNCVEKNLWCSFTANEMYEKKTLNATRCSQWKATVPNCNQLMELNYSPVHSHECVNSPTKTKLRVLITSIMKKKCTINAWTFTLLTSLHLHTEVTEIHSYHFFGYVICWAGHFCN